MRHLTLKQTLLLEIELFSRRETDLAVVFLHRLTENHDLSETEFLVDAYDYLNTLSRLELSGHLDYRWRNNVEKWF